jgi:transcription elongation factor Elf1
MWTALGVLIGVLLLLWYLVAAAWASSVARHNPELHEGVQRSRYGWRCPQCGTMTAPSCTVNKCGGPLVWVQRETRIKCSRCHRYLIAHPMLFQQVPRPGRARCRQCGWSGLIKEWKIS